MRITLLAAFVLLCVAACGGGDDSGGTTPTLGSYPNNPAFDSLKSKPLNLPSVSSGQCPVSEAQLLIPTQPFVLGSGPVYPTGLGSESVLHIGAVLTGSDWLGKGVTWLAAPVFRGKVLIRGGRIDAQGVIGFDYAPDVRPIPTTDELELDTADTAPDPDGWHIWNTYARMKEPGCYAFQVDTDVASYTLVFRTERQA